MALAGASLPLAAQKVDIPAHWRTGGTIVDGDPSEWEGLTSAVADANVSVGVVNDGETFYLCLLASDLQTREQILRRGLIVWFDPAAGTKKAFGIKFPVGTVEAPAGRSGARSARGGGKKVPEPTEVVNRLEVLGPGKDDRRSLVLDQVPGIHVRVGQPEGMLVYELSIPLARTSAHPYAVGAKPGSMIGLGLVTPEQEKVIAPADGPPRSGSGGRGGMGGFGGMSGGMGGPRSDTNRGEAKPLKPMKTWLRVRLAAPGSAGDKAPA